MGRSPACRVRSRRSLSSAAYSGIHPRQADIFSHRQRYTGSGRAWGVGYRRDGVGFCRVRSRGVSLSACRVRCRAPGIWGGARVALPVGLVAVVFCGFCLLWWVISLFPGCLSHPALLLTFFGWVALPFLVVGLSAVPRSWWACWDWLARCPVRTATCFCVGRRLVGAGRWSACWGVTGDLGASVVLDGVVLFVCVFWFGLAVVGGCVFPPWTGVFLAVGLLAFGGFWLPPPLWGYRCGDTGCGVVRDGVLVMSLGSGGVMGGAIVLFGGGAA